MKKNNNFLVWLLVTVVCASLFSSVGAKLDSLGYVSVILIMLMYFSMGLGIDMTVLHKGLTDWKVHLMVQLSLFVIGPLVSFAAFLCITPFVDRFSAIGLVFVGCLPTTITSCVMLTMRSKGNAAAAIYNAVFSQLLGVFVTPFVLSLILRYQIGQVVSVWAVIFSLIQKMILPLILGQLVRKYMKKITTFLGTFPEKFSFYAIFGILFLNLSTVISQGNFYENIRNLAIPLIAACLLYIFMLLLIWFLSGIFHFSVYDRICIAFTGSQKTLGMGVPLASIFFAGNATQITNVTLVIITYYISSILFSVLIVDKLAKQT